VFINKIRLKNFRCFNNKTYNFENNFIIIEGKNGSGKTSLLEAISYACYFRSFRTRSNQELVSFKDEHFFVQVDFSQNSGESNQINIGFSSENGKLVKFNQKQIQSYKEVLDFYRVVSVTDEDLLLVGGPPEYRRSFLNQSLFLQDSENLIAMRQYKKVLDQRNSFLKNIGERKLTQNLHDELYTWTKQLWELSIVLQKERVEFLREVEQECNNYLKTYFSDTESIEVLLTYMPRNMQPGETFEKYWKKYQAKHQEKEFKLGRSFFGAHLDDFVISFQSKKARTYASRGQQKLVLFLLKVVQLKKLQRIGEPGCLLLDDFLTDFDDSRLTNALTLLFKLNCQVFITCPLQSFIVSKISNFTDFQVLEL
jgi:DNA replication and repair protein RecF